MLVDKVDTQVLKLALSHQTDRVSANDTSVSFKFTEGWFRDSGLYDLNEDYQQTAMVKRLVILVPPAPGGR